MLTDTERRRRQQEAIELNDAIVQGLSVARLALELNETDRAGEAIDRTLAAARRIVTKLLEDLGDEAWPVAPGDLVRAKAAALDELERDGD